MQSNAVLGYNTIDLHLRKSYCCAVRANQVQTIVVVSVTIDSMKREYQKATRIYYIYG